MAPAAHGRRHAPDLIAGLAPVTSSRERALTSSYCLGSDSYFFFVALAAPAAFPFNSAC